MVVVAAQFRGWRRPAWIVPALLAGLVAGCGQLPSRPAATAPRGPVPRREKDFVSARYGVSMHYPADLHAQTGFRAGYFLGTRWNPDAPAEVPGRGLLTLVLPQSNHLLTGELRLGASAARRARAGCRLPDAGTAGPGAVSHPLIGGVRFAERATEDAGMSHFLRRRAYRGMVHGCCYAIDLIVDGTDPGVYPGHPVPPMTAAAAMARLRGLLSGLHFTATGAAAPARAGE